MLSRSCFCKQNLTTLQSQGFWIADRIFAADEIEQFNPWVDKIQHWQGIFGKYITRCEI